MVHSKIWYSNQFNDLKPTERLLYIGMITHADDFGRLRGDSPYLKVQIFPYGGVSDLAVDKMRNRIAEVGLITIYSDTEGLYVHHPNWDRYQILRKDRLKVSEFPDPPTDNCPSDDGQLTAQGKRNEGNGIEEKRKELNAKMDVRKAIMSGLPNGGKDSMFAKRAFDTRSGEEEGNDLPP